MALKPCNRSERNIYTYFFDGVGERGGIASVNKEQPYINRGILVVSYNEDLSCRPVGILCHDVVDIDLNKTPYIPGGSTVRSGSMVGVISDGIVVTNQIIGDPQPGHLGLLYQSGQILVWAYPKLPKSMRKYLVGKFLTKKDQDGFAKFILGGIAHV